MSKKQKTVSAWTIVIIAFFGGFALANVQNKVPPVIDVLMVSFGIGETDAGWLMSVFTIMGMITALPATALIRKYGSKKIGVLALACAAIGSAAGAFVTTMSLLMLTRVIEGVGVGLIAVVGPTIISEWFPPERRGLPMGLWGSWMMCSQTLLFLIGGGLASAFGWQGVWWFCTIFCVVVLVFYQLKVEDPGVGETNYIFADVNQDFHFGEAFRSVSTWLITLCGLIFTFCCFGFATYISLYWAATFTGGDMGASNLWVAILYAIEIPMVIFIGWLLNRVKPAKRHWVGAIGFALYVFVLLVCFRIDNPAFIIPFIIIYPFLEGTIPTVYWTVTPSTVKNPEHASVALGMLNVGLNIGTLLGPPCTGFFLENFGWSTATIPLAAAAVVGAVLFSFVKTYDEVPEREDSAAV